MGPRIGVIGGGTCDPETARLAERVGRCVAQRGGILLCGGLGGIMEAAARGAREAGGLTVGILPGVSDREANPYIVLPVVTGMGHARNVILVQTAQALIALPGKYGTLSEIAFALLWDKPVVSLGSWEVDARVVRALDPEEAVDRAWELLGAVSPEA